LAVRYTIESFHKRPVPYKGANAHNLDGVVYPNPGFTAVLCGTLLMSFQPSNAITIELNKQ